jgi:methyl-accepting chemotaxis protein
MPVNKDIDMKRLAVLRATLSVKLTLAFLLAILVTLALVGGLAFQAARQILVANAEQELVRLAESKHRDFLLQLDRARVGLELIARNPATANHLVALSESSRALGERRTAALQGIFIDNNPFPTGEREKYDGPALQPDYAFAHAGAHRAFKAAKEINGWYDLLLIDDRSDVVYTVEKEHDFATSLDDGPWRATELASLYRAIKNDWRQRPLALTSLAHYGPSNDIPALFLGAPVLDARGELIGVIVAQLDLPVIDQAFDLALGEGERALLIGGDGLLWTSPAAVPAYKPLETRISTEDLGDAAAGESRILRLVAKDGQDAIRVSIGVDAFGQKLFVVVARTMEVIEAPVRKLAWELLTVALVVMAVLALGALMLGRSFAKPLVRMAAAVGELAAGKQADVPALDRRDEIGRLARSLQLIHQHGVEAIRVKAALDTSQSATMLADAEGKVVYANAAMIRLLQSLEPTLRLSTPDFSAATIVGQNIDRFHKNPAHQRAILAQAEGAHKATVRIGGHTLSLTHSPVLDAAGNRVGTVAEWMDCTAWLTAEEQIGSVVRSAAAGDFSGRVPLDGKSESTRAVAEGLNQVSSMVESAIEEFAGTLEALARGDLTRRIKGDHRGCFASFKSNLNETLDRLASIVTAIQAAASEIKTAASEINAGADDLARRNEQQASSLEETARTTRELATSVEHGAQRSTEANRLAREARQLAEQGRLVVAEAITAMGKIEQASVRTGDITLIIQEIASETKLLAFNAEVEAEHAGEKGRGFAVVAQEVGTLADRSRDAAKDIKALIETNNREIKEGVTLFKNAGEVLEHILQKSQLVDDRIGEISTAARQQAHGIKEMSQTVAHMDGITQSNAGLAEQSAASSRSLAERIASLQRQVGFFTIRADAASRSAVPPRPAHDRGIGSGQEIGAEAWTGTGRVDGHAWVEH